VRHAGGIQDEGALAPDLFGPPVVDIGRSVEADARVTMIVVIPGEESGAVRVRILEGPKAVRELRPVFERAKVTLRIRVVVGCVRARVGLGHPVWASGSTSRTAHRLEGKVASPTWQGRSRRFTGSIGAIT